MKQAKQYPFYRIWQQRFRLHSEDRSGFTGLPAAQQWRRWIWQALKHDCARAEIGLLLLDEAEARAYNRDYRGKDYATNVLSFALNEGETLPPEDDGILRGDLLICPQVVAREAAEQGKTLTQHCAHLAVHGTLHLMGYDHIDDTEAEDMEALETRLLAQMGYPDPYAQERD